MFESKYNNNILKSINFQVAGIPSLSKEKNMNVKSMSYTGKVLWTVWELDVEDYEILLLKQWYSQRECLICESVLFWCVTDRWNVLPYWLCV